MNYHNGHVMVKCEMPRAIPACGDNDELHLVLDGTTVSVASAKCES